VVLAAGAGTRFTAGASKLVAPFRGRPLVWWAIEHALQAGIGPVWVVTGAVDLRGTLPEGAEALHNERWVEGQATSLQTAVAAARAAGLEAIVVGLGDQPMVPPLAWRSVALAEGDAPVVVATYHRKRGNPVRLSSQVWDLLPQEGDEGGRVLMRSRPDLVSEVACEGNPADIDTKEDLLRWS
jgi:molybdenum cofactor cytidylyltransferase